MRLLAVLLLPGLLGGCLGLQGGDGCPATYPVLATPMVDGLYMQTDPGQTWQTVVRSPAANATSDMTLAWTASPGWSVSGRRLSLPEDPVFQVATVEPGPGAGNLTLEHETRTHDGACQNTQRGSLAWDLASSKAGDAAMPGQGVHVMTAGFFENGTLFYTNIAEVDADGRWPKVPWYGWEGADPLPVYVYDADRAEEPAHWRTPSTHVSPLAQEVPDSGHPGVDEAVDGLGSMADNETGLGYFTTIPGFNAALKGLSTTTTRVVRLEPEQAYTRAGNEEHPLYGHAIVFYIKVLDVVDAPCPVDIRAWMCRAAMPIANETASETGHSFA